MDLEKRIERAAKVMQDIINSSTREPWTVHVPALRLVLEAFAPELFSSPPAAWIAPWTPTKGMVAGWGSLDQAGARSDYAKMRDAYLSRQVKP